MSDIWHTPPQTPDVFKSHPIIVVYEAGDQIEQMNSKEYSDLVGERYVNRWCYVDDLIKENERTCKALDVAVDALKSAKTRLELINNSKFANLNNVLQIQCQCEILKIEKFLEQITTLEQKDVK